MVLIPSAFFAVLFEPITLPIIAAWHKFVWFMKWVGIAVLYLLAIAVIFFLAIAVFVAGSEISKYFGA